MGKPQPRRITKKQPVVKKPGCPHKADRIQIVTNRNGKQFKECGSCGAFLGWV